MISDKAVARYIVKNGGRVGLNPILAKEMIDKLNVKRKGRPTGFKDKVMQYNPLPKHEVDLINQEILKWKRYL
jgi:membrane-bound lytic murein transglycosylase MltF